MADHSIIVWRRLDQPGLEYCALVSSDTGHSLAGTVVGIEHGRRYCLEYSVRCDQLWLAREANIDATIDGEHKHVDLQAGSDGIWVVDGQPAPRLSGCHDIDLAFSPATNTLPIRRLHLTTGAAGPSRAVYVSFPALTVSMLGQTYRRLSDEAYLYRVDDGSFENTLTVSEEGFVTSYPPFWEKVG
jgi:uncharacterized protein